MEPVNNDYSIVYRIGHNDFRIYRPNGYKLAKYLTMFRVLAVFWFLVFLVKLIISLVQVLTAIAKE